MGGAIARGLIAAGLGTRLILIDPGMKQADVRAFRKAGATTGNDVRVLTGANPEAIILAVKPQMMAQVAPAYAAAARSAPIPSTAASSSTNRPPPPWPSPGRARRSASRCRM